MSIHRREGVHGRTYCVKLRDPNGKQISRSFKKLADAQRWETSCKRRRDSGDWTDVQMARMSFRELTALWIGVTFPQKKELSRERDQCIINRYLLPVLGDIPINSIKPIDIRQMINTWTTQKLAPNTIRRHLAVLSGILNNAVENDFIAKNPAKSVKLKEIVQVRPIRHITPEEVEKILNQLDPISRTITMVFATVGLRFSELAGLTLDSLDLDSVPATLTVKQSVHFTKTGMKIQKPKSKAGIRTIYLNHTLVNELRNYLNDTGRINLEETAFVFTSPEGGPLRYNNFTRRKLEPARLRAGVPHFTTASFRKGLLTYLNASGVDIKTVQGIAGHADSRTTLTHYISATDAARLAASAASENLIAGTPTAIVS